VDEAATALRLGRTMVYALMQAGVLSFIKIGKRRLIPVSGLKTLVDHLSNQGVTE
jgi:excisionase family DNA binding protein